jgi:D-glycero-D-manno-heptose 1,7-bisphosphate phosphatase
MQRRSAVFVDRDGVINVYRPDYVKSWDEFVFLPSSLLAFRRLAMSPYAVVVVSNQSIIGRGIVEKDTVDTIHQRMTAEIVAYEGRIDDVVYCPHHPDAMCACRKPKPGMLLAAASRANLNLASSYFIGDAPSDVAAALAAGCTPVLVLTGRGRKNYRQLLRQYPNLDIAENLLDAVDWILSHEQK